MSDDEDEVVTATLTGAYRQFTPGDRVILFKADKAFPICHLSNLGVSPVHYDGIDYPSVEHAFQAQKFQDKHLFSTSGVFGNPTDHFHEGWTAYFAAKTPRGDNSKKVEQKKKYYAKKNTYGVLAKMVNNLSRKPGKSVLLGLRPNPNWNFGDAHERLWLTLLRSKFQDPAMRTLLLETGDAYLIEYQKFEKVKGTDTDLVDFYTAYYNDGECKHCNEPRCNAIGKFLMKIRDEIRPKRKSPTRKSPSPKRNSTRKPESPRTPRMHWGFPVYGPPLTDADLE